MSSLVYPFCCTRFSNVRERERELIFLLSVAHNCLGFVWTRFLLVLRNIKAALLNYDSSWTRGRGGALDLHFRFPIAFYKVDLNSPMRWLCI